MAWRYNEAAFEEAMRRYDEIVAKGPSHPLYVHLIQGANQYWESKGIGRRGDGTAANPGFFDKKRAQEYVRKNFGPSAYTGQKVVRPTVHPGIAASAQETAAAAAAEAERKRKERAAHLIEVFAKNPATNPASNPAIAPYIPPATTPTTPSTGTTPTSPPPGTAPPPPIETSEAEEPVVDIMSDKEKAAGSTPRAKPFVRQRGRGIMNYGR